MSANSILVVFVLTSVSYAVSDEIGNGKPAVLSSLLNSGWAASNINDGLLDECSHTAANAEMVPYIYIDLSGRYSIERMEITNRENCCQDRLIDGVVRIGESADDVVSNKQCGEPVTSEEVYADRVVIRECDQSLFARFVSVSIENTIIQALNLCEIEVFSNVKSLQYNNHCYKIFNTPASWSDAKSACEEQNWKLLTINTEEERTFITNELSSFSSLSNVWTGLNDIDVEGSPDWLTHDGPTYMNYDGASDSEEMDCFRISASDNSLRHEYCHVEAAYICEERTLDYKRYTLVARDKSPTDEYLIRTLSTVSYGACSVECSLVSACSSFSFSKLSHECQLSTSTGLDQEITDAVNTDFYKVTLSDVLCIG